MRGDRSGEEKARIEKIEEEERSAREYQYMSRSGGSVRQSVFECVCVAVGTRVKGVGVGGA